MGLRRRDQLIAQVVLNTGKNLFKFSKEILGYTKKLLVDDFKTSVHKVEAAKVSAMTVKWLGLSAAATLMAARNKDVVGSASVDYLMYSGYVTMSYFWLQMMEVAAAKLASNPSPEDVDFYKGKIATGKFYFQHLLPRANAHARTMLISPRKTMAITENQFFAGRS